MNIGTYKLENTFLTSANTVAMQWVERGVRNITVYKDKRGRTKYTSTVTVPENILNMALAYYEENWEKVLNPKLR